MECKINHKVDYLDISGMIMRQRESVYNKIRQISNSHAVYPGLTCFQEGITSIPVEEIRGVKEAGWKPPPLRASRHQEIQRQTVPSKDTELQAKLGAVLKSVKSLKDAWPFHKPVDAKLVPDYYDIIKFPMDLGTMGKRLHEGHYTNKEMFIADFQLIVDNCRKYNLPTTTYYRCAASVEAHFFKILGKLDI